MIIIPEIETVVILVPRTGSGSLRKAIAQRYPKSFMLYRHMEADGVPQGYDRWRRVGVVRNPVERLWSLYKFLPSVTRYGDLPQAKLWEAAQHDSTRGKSFEEWLLTNETPFAGTGGFAYTECRHAMAENRKSARIYLRPDLGTQIIRYSDLSWQVGIYFGISDFASFCENLTSHGPAPMLSVAAREYVEDVFAWDLQMCPYLERV